MRRRISQALILVLLLSVVALPGQHARASTDIPISGPVTQGQWEYYNTTPRFVTYGPWEIAVNKTEGPALRMQWWDCQGVEYGPVKYFPNADPTGYIWLSQYTKSDSYRFCLAAYSEGNDPTDTFDADLSYDG